MGRFPRWLNGKESACNAGELGLIPGLGSLPGEGIGNPFQYYCLENPMDRGAWQATVLRVAESNITERLSLSPQMTADMIFSCCHFLLGPFQILPNWSI